MFTRVIASVVATAVCLSAAAMAAEDLSSLRVSVNFNKTEYKAALAELQEKAGLKISFAEKLIAHARPVTLKLDKAPVEKVLREILRPEGLEAIQTDSKLIAIVPGFSDMGMSKAFGRALSTGIRLGNKLDGAVVAGDEVRVPEWTDEDDRELAEGLTDLIASASFIESTRNRSETSSENRLERLWSSHDPLVRAGAVLQAISSGMRHRAQHYNSFMKAGIASSNSAERTSAALMFAANLERTSPEFPHENPEATLAVLAADPEASVRMTAALALLIGMQRNLKVDPNGKMLEQFLNDRSMFVRQTPRFTVLANRGMVARLESNDSAKRLQSLDTSEGIKSMCKDENPIARAVSLGFALVAAGNKQSHQQQITDYLASADHSRDPWMDWILKKLKPMLADNPRVPFAELRDAVLSRKRSHQIAAVALGAQSLVFKQPRNRTKGATAAQEPMPDLSGLTALSQSDWPWARYAGTLADGIAPASRAFPETKLSAEQLDAAEKRFRAALTSPEEATRLIALLGVQLRKTLRVPDSADYKADDAFLRAAQSRTVSEMMLGTSLSAQNLSSDQILMHLQAMLSDESRRDAAEFLMLSIQYVNQNIRALKPEQQVAFWKRMTDLILAQQDLRLEAALTARLGWGSQERQKGVLPSVLKQGQIETVLAICMSGQATGFNDADEVSLLAERLEEAAENRIFRKQLLNAWHQLATSHVMWTNTPPNMFNALNTVLKEPPADAEEEALRVQALVGYWTLLDRDEKKRESILYNPHAPAIREMQRVFALASSNKQIPLTPKLVAQTVEIGRRKNVAPQWATHCPQLAAAAEAALRSILESERIDDKMEVWVPLVRSGDPASVSTLAKLVNEGGLPAKHMSVALYALTPNPNLVPEWYGKTLLRLARDTNQKQEVRAAALNSASYFSKTIQDDLEAMVFDATLNEQLRTQAAHAAGTSEKSRVFQKALESFDAQPGYLVTALLDRAIYSMKAPGATDFVLRALPDKRVIGRANAWMGFHSLAFTLSQERTLTTFKEPQKLIDALDSIEKNWPAEGRDEFKAHVLPQLQKVKQQIAEMKAKAGVKNGKESTPAVRPPPPPPGDF